MLESIFSKKQDYTAYIVGVYTKGNKQEYQGSPCNDENSCTIRINVSNSLKRTSVDYTYNNKSLSFGQAQKMLEQLARIFRPSDLKTKFHLSDKPTTKVAPECMIKLEKIAVDIGSLSDRFPKRFPQQKNSS